MTDFLSIIREKFKGKYDFLRIGNVRLVVEEKKAFVTFLVPEDVYDYSMTKDDIAAINETVKELVGGEYSVICRYEKIILSAESVKSELIEYMSKYFPLVAANIDFSKVTVEIGDTLTLRFMLPQNIADYIQKIDFESKLAAHFQEKMVIKADVVCEICEDATITQNARTQSTSTGRYGKSVEVTDKALVMGKLSDLHGLAVHISTLKGEGEDVCCCGTINYLSFKTRKEEDKAKYKRFFKHYYTFSITDTTGYLNIFINTDTELPALQNGVEVICKGRVNTREESNNFSMYVKSIATCKIPFALIKEQTKPLDPPEEYSVLIPQAYHEVVYDQLDFDLLGEKKEKRHNPTAYGVSVAMRSLKNERSYVPYEIAMCEIEKGEITRYLHTYLKVAFTDGSDKAAFANQKGYSSPRLSTVIPDLIKFTAGRLLIGFNPAAIMDLLNLTARPLRYLFHNDLHVISPSATGENAKKESALEEAVALAHAFIEE